jgi:O-antigen/teichoic acid export membrane protein
MTLSAEGAIHPCDAIGHSSHSPILSSVRSRQRFSLPFQDKQPYPPTMQELTIVLQALVAASVFFVWVVRYNNIIQEFKQYGLPDWLRDLVGILKLTFALLLLLGVQGASLAMIGGLGIAGLMGCAFAMHLRVKNPVFKMLPSLTLLVLSLIITVINYRLLTP